MSGYILIDAPTLDLTKGSTEQTISGIYARVQAAMKTNKPIFVENAKWGTKVMTPIQVMCQQEDATTVVATASTLQIWITSADKVTIVNLVA